jgi:hypothetical protein
MYFTPPTIPMLRRYQQLFLFILMFPAAPLMSQTNHELKHTYKVRLRTTDNGLHRGLITMVNDSAITLLWHGEHVAYAYQDIKRIIVFRKGIIGKLMLASVPLSIAGGLAISRNQPTPDNSTRWLNNFAAVTMGFSVGVVEAAIVGKIIRRRYNISGEQRNFIPFVQHIAHFKP